MNTQEIQAQINNLEAQIKAIKAIRTQKDTDKLFGLRKQINDLKQLLP